MADAGSIEEQAPSDIESIISSTVSSKSRKITLPGKGQLNKSFLRPNLKRAIAKTIKNQELLRIINNETDTKKKAEAFIRRTIPDTPAPSKRFFEELQDKEDIGDFQNPNERKTLLTILRRSDIPLDREDIANIDDEGSLGNSLRKFVEGEFTKIPSREERQEAMKGGATQAGAAEPAEEEEPPRRPRKRQTKRPASPPATPDQPTSGEGKETTIRRGDMVDETKDGEMEVDGDEVPITQDAPSTDNPTGDATGVLENRTPQEGQGERPREVESEGAGIPQPEGEAVARAGAGAGEDTPTAGIEQTTEEGVAQALGDAIEEQPEFMEDLQREAQAVEAAEAQAEEQQAPMEEGETFESVSPQPSAIDLITASGLLSKPKYHGRLIQNARELVGQHDHLKGLKAGRKIGVKKVFTKPTSKRADLEQEYHEVSMLIHFWYSTKLGVGTNQPRVGMLLPQSAIGGLAPLLQQLGQLTQGGMGGMGQPQEHPAHTQHLTPKQQLQRNLAQATGQPLVEQTPTQPREIPREMDRPRNRPFDLSSRYGVKDRVRRNIMNRAGMSEGLSLNFG